jgi:cytochrome o ubiquinol oxidase subunit 2
MSFDVNVVSESDFAAWTQRAAGSDRTLDVSAYTQLAQPSTKSERAVYRLDDPHLFDAIVTQKLPPGPGPSPDPRPAAPSSTPRVGVTDAR